MVDELQKLTGAGIVILLIALLLTGCGPAEATSNSGTQEQPMRNSSQPVDALGESGPADSSSSVPDGPDTPVSGEPGQPGGAGGGGIVQGQVTDSAGKPIAGVMVVPASTDNPPQAVPEMAVMTSEEGRYEWTLTPGTYRLTFNADGYAPAAQDVIVKPDQPTTLDIALQQQ